jgi:hypothetical protein
MRSGLVLVALPIFIATGDRRAVSKLGNFGTPALL